MKTTFSATIILIVSLMISGYSSLHAQCPDQGFLFVNQSSVDNFITDYPDCTELKGTLYIKYSQVLNLDGLSHITRIDGNLIFRYADSIRDLTALSNLEYIGGSLILDDNKNFESLAGLEKLTSIGRDIDIEFNPKLTNIDALSNISSVGANNTSTIFNSEILFVNNALLSSISGLSGLSKTPNLYLKDNPSLTTLYGLHNVETIDGNIQIRNCDGIIDFSGLENLTDVTEYMDINSNEKLTSLNGLENLTSIERIIRIDYNPQLLNVNGLNNLESIAQINIEGNNQLININLNSVETANRIKIFENDMLTSISLNSVQSLYNAFYEASVYIENNEKLESIDLRNLKSASILNIENNNDLSILDLGSLDSLELDFNIIENPNLNNIALDNLFYIGNALRLEQTSLINLDAFKPLKSLGKNAQSTSGTLIIYNNDVLTNLEGLNNISYYNGSLEITENDSLTNCAITFICTRIANPTGFAFIFSNNAGGCNSIDEISEGCNIAPNNYFISDTDPDQCSSILSLDISSAQGNNNEFIHILDNSGDILCSIDANGNDLGITNFELFLSSVDRVSVPLVMNRDISIIPTNQPTSPVRVRLFYSEEELTALQVLEPTISDYSDLSVIQSDAPCDGIIDATNLISQTRSGNYSNEAFFVEVDAAALSTFHAGGDNISTSNIDYTPKIENSFEINPNPVQTYFEIKNKNEFNAENYLLNIYHTNGSKISTQSLTTNNQSFNISKLASGAYILTIMDKYEKIIFSDVLIKL